MAVLPNVAIPIEGVRHVQPNTEIYVEKNMVGKGTFYITERAITWVGDPDKSLTIPFVNIILHAVSRDTKLFPRDCIFLHTDAELPFSVPAKPDADEEDQEDEEDFGYVASKSTEVLIVPDDSTCLNQLYQIMCDCQALNPDPPMEDIFSDEDFFEGDEEVEDADERMAELNLSNGDDADMDPDRYEDAEEGLPDPKA